jgi:IPT/TIG domain
VGQCSVNFSATDGVHRGMYGPLDAATGAQVFNITADPTAPTVTAITPATGPTLGGTGVTITGTGFTGATGVTIGGQAAAFTFVNDTSITATTPVGTAGTANVVVTTPLDGNAANTLYTYALSPQVVSFTSTAPTLPVVGATYTPTVTGGAGTAPVVISVSGACSIGANNLVTFNAAGTCLINADQAADANYAAAPQVQQLLPRPPRPSVSPPYLRHLCSAPPSSWWPQPRLV